MHTHDFTSLPLHSESYLSQSNLQVVAVWSLFTIHFMKSELFELFQCTYTHRELRLRGMLMFGGFIDHNLNQNACVCGIYSKWALFTVNVGQFEKLRSKNIEDVYKTLWINGGGRLFYIFTRLNMFCMFVIVLLVSDVYLASSQFSPELSER